MMFYEKNQLDRNLECPLCTNRYESAKILSCGDTICNYCIQDIFKTLAYGQKQFECPLCRTLHALPVDRQFPDNKIVMRLLQEEPKEMERAKNVFKELQVNLDQNREKQIRLKSFLINKGVDKVQEHCANIRLDVYLAAEIKVNEIEQLGQEWFSKNLPNNMNRKIRNVDQGVNEIQGQREDIILAIDQFENDCINGLKNESIFENVATKVKNLEDFNSLWNANLLKCSTSEGDIETASKYLSNIQLELDQTIKELTSLIFINKECTFQRSDESAEEQLNDEVIDYLDLGDLNILDRPERTILIGERKKSDYLHTSVALEDGNLAVCTMGGLIQIWNPKNGVLAKQIKAYDEGDVHCLVVLKDGRIASTDAGFNKGLVKIWNPSTGELTKEIEVGWHLNDTRIKLVALMNGNLATSDLNRYCGNVEIWDPLTGELVEKKDRVYDDGFRDSVDGFAEMRDGHLAVSTAGGITIYNPVNGKIIRKLRGVLNCFDNESEDDHEYIWKILADGNLAVTDAMNSMNGEIRVFDIKTGKLTRTVTGHESSVWCMTVLSNGTVASGSNDGQIRIWNPETGILLRKIDSDGKPVTCIVELPDERIASMHEDESHVKIWDIRTVSDSGNEHAVAPSTSHRISSVTTKTVYDVELKMPKKKGAVESFSRETRASKRARVDN